MEFKRIGILGGMGPEASANFYYKLIRYCQNKYQAVQDTDYPPVIIYSLPLSGFDESGIVDKELVLNQLFDGIKILGQAKCDFIVMPCNTVHTFIEELRAKSSVPIISIIEETVKKVKQDNLNIVGLLASETTLKLNLYQNLFDKHNITCFSPAIKDFVLITNLILEIMGGKVKNSTKMCVLSIINKMEQEKKVKAVVLGCTEMPLAISQNDTALKIYDSLQILAESAVDYSVNISKIQPININLF